MNPSDPVSPDEAEGENVCPDCSGSGRRGRPDVGWSDAGPSDGGVCPTCGGSGTVIEPVGGA